MQLRKVMSSHALPGLTPQRPGKPLEVWIPASDKRTYCGLLKLFRPVVDTLRRSLGLSKITSLILAMLVACQSNPDLKAAGLLRNITIFGEDIVNAGKLRKRADGKWVNWANNVIPADEVTRAVHKHETVEAGWHEYTEAQIETALRVGSALQSTYKFTDILGHDDICPDQKVDPCPLFPMSSFRSRILGRA
jgi:hypothetical protein